MLNPIHLRTLQECVRTGSFAVAARSLGYTPSAISQQIGVLERTVGAPLFERAAHSVRPTSIALALANRCGDALDALQEVETEIRAMVSGDAGTLRLACFATANTTVVPTALAAIAAQRPRAEVHLEEGEPDEVLELVTEGSVDCAVVFGYDLAPRNWPVTLRHKELLAEPLAVALPGAEPEVHELADLKDRPWICTKKGTGAARSLDRLAADAGFTPQVRFRSNDYGVIHQLVARGLGVALMPRLAVREEGVRISRITGVSSYRRVSVLYRPNNTNPLLTVALDCLTRACVPWRDQERSA
ncbi:LysR family transcriptional regulator [Sciscionella sediminilitoris]|uniref:LysR family transcriptional regulator n=1 Tax=Sciscionella sediminilitoris TaxID=1445613 RepID=UPI0004DED5C1|nr:LysR family transcriptional regulator [Sciscionella sp. SE31]